MAPSGIAVIVGVGGGLGESIAKKFSSAGLHVALIARTEAYLAKVQKDIEGAGGSAKVYTCDVTKEDQVKAASGKILEDAKKDGRSIEVLVYNPRLADCLIVRRALFGSHLNFDSAGTTRTSLY